VSRTWAALGRYLVAHDGQDVWLGQYVGAEVDLTGLRLEITSELPWGGRVEVAVVADEPTERTLSLRIPSWSGPPRVSVDGQLVPCPQPEEGPVTGQGYSPFRASWLPITRCWEGRTRIELDLPMEVVVHRAHPSVRTHQGMVALSRGPLVYCLESCDNPEAGVPEACLDPAVATEVREAPELLGGVHLVEARDDAGRPLVLVPYYAWANRGPSQMQVWVREHKAQLRDQPNPARRSTDARTDSSSSSAR